MALRGKAVLAIWNGIATGLDGEFQSWHVHEHIPERVALPGFLRGRRYVAIDGHPKYFNFYEAECADVFTSESYRQALNAASAWTQQVVRHFLDTSRTICNVTASYGQGNGTVVETIQIAQAPGAEGLLSRLNDQLAPQLHGIAGVVGVHVLQGQGEMGRQATAETKLRGGQDAQLELALLVEMTDPAMVAQLRMEALSDQALIDLGADARIHRGSYALQYILSKEDLCCNQAG